MLLFALAACSGNPFLGDDCAKVYCGAGQICLRTSDGDDEPDTSDTSATSSDNPFGNLPECTPAPAECGPVVTCACLPDCTTCEKRGGLVHCEVEAP